MAFSLTGLVAWLRAKRAPAAPLAPPVHTRDEDHEWFTCFRQQNPPCDVADCACGARAKIYPGLFGVPELRVVTPPSSESPQNALIINGESALGDPQGAALRVLTS